jgi:hypothetical protein
MQTTGTPDYGTIRAMSYGVALAALPMTLRQHVPGQFQGTPINFTEIDAAALTEWSNHWHKFMVGYGGWDWQRIARYYQVMHDDRFEVAIWSGSVLCGFGVGKPRFGWMEVNNMEGDVTP